jgi:protein-S-isoprenylcysteine O-methyltransferase Ste14
MMPRWPLYPPVWFLTLLCLQWVLVRQWPTPLDLPGFLRWGGLGVALAGGALFIAATVAFRRHRTTILPFEDGSERLIDSGVFRYSRNPIYLAEALILLGTSLLWSQAWPWLCLPVFVLGIDRNVIRWEEATLRARFGERYTAYCRRVRRWL